MGATLAEPEQRNPFTTAEAWLPRRVKPYDDVLYRDSEQTRGGELEPLTDTERAVFRAFAEHAFDEPQVCVSQKEIAARLGIARETVNRAVAQLRAKGWMEKIEERWFEFSRWSHNVYTLHGPFAVSELAAKRITRRAHARNRVRRGPDHTKRGRTGHRRGERCCCRCCRRERGGRKGYVGPNPGDLARRRWRPPAGRRWRAEFATQLRFAGYHDPLVAFDLDHRLDPLPGPPLGWSARVAA